MKKNFTKLVSFGIVCLSILSAMAQERSASIKITDENLFIEKDINLRAEVDGSFIYFWPDSAIDYNNMGEPILKKYYDKENQSCIEGSFENGNWIFSASESSNGYPFANTKGTIRYEFSEKGLIFYFPSMSEMSYFWHGNITPEFYSVTPYYDSKGNLTMLQAVSNSYNNVLFEVQLEYNESNDILSITGNVEAQYKYDENGRLYSLGYNRANYNEEGQLISIHNSYTKIYTILYYSDGTNIPNVEIDNNTPIGNENQGNFDLNVNILIDSIGNGSITISFPDGLMLDEKNTSLTLDFANLFILTITKQENNSWLLEIKPKTLRSALFRAYEAKKMLQVAYVVDEMLQRGTYDISVNSILFETKGGNYIPEPAIIIPAVVERWGVGNETINRITPVIYTDNQTINIQVANTERITIYSIMGQKLYETEMQSGLNSINAANFTKGILIIKGNSGWSKKLINK